MISKAYVKEIIGGRAVLSVKRECACELRENCDVKKCLTLQDEAIEIVTDNSKIGARAGDFVEVEGKTPAILLYCLVVFILPVFTGIFSYFIAGKLTENIIVPYIISGISSGISMILSCFRINAAAEKREDYKITKILGE
ncbi:MAG: SoxR reducing system RseC family protein [Oscillospiraceae bacterium]|nr:SoxR reducing system RseC family protein [Oscillospiraceae bacterium]